MKTVIMSGLYPCFCEKLAENGYVLVAQSEGKWITTGDPKNYFLAHLEYSMKYSDYKDAIDECYNKLKEEK